MYAVIMAGGTGTRFWPLSRERFPKQFLSIFGSESMIQQTTERISPLIPYNDIYIVTNPHYAEEIKHLHPVLNDKLGDNFIIEPLGRNTAPALGLAALYLKKADPDGIMVAMPADHVIEDEKSFLEALKSGDSIAQKGSLVTIGIKPTGPETGYGYIKYGIKDTNALDEDKGFYDVESFVEKPTLDKAKHYIKTGGYLWNTGIFIWKVSVFLNEIKTHMPELYKGLELIEEVIGTKDEEDVVAKVYSGLKPESVDYGIMEKAKNVVVIPSSFGWNDVGSWKALDDLLEKDTEGNIIYGNVISIDSSNSILYGGKRLVAAVGIDHTIVVDTDDATLVCPKDRAQDVKKIVQVLKERDAAECFTHKTVYRPWGLYTVLEKGNGFKIRKLEVKPGASLGLHRHIRRSEHWIVVSGKAKVTVDDRVCLLGASESIFIPIKVKYGLENPYSEFLHIIEVQCGDYLEEDDIEVFNEQERVVQ